MPHFHSFWTTACSLFVAFCLTATPSLAQSDSQRSEVELTEKGKAVHFSGLLFDGHNDLPWEVRKQCKSSFKTIDISKAQPEMHTDIPRLREGGLKAQFWSVYVPGGHF